MTKSRTQTRVDAITAVQALSRQSVQQDGQIDALIDRLVAAANTITEWKRKAESASTAARYYREYGEKVQRKLDERGEQMGAMIRDLTHEIERLLPKFDFSNAFRASSYPLPGAITSINLASNIGMNFAICQFDLARASDSHLRMIAESSAERSLTGITRLIYQQLQTERDRMRDRSPS